MRIRVRGDVKFTGVLPKRLRLMCSGSIWCRTAISQYRYQAERVNNEQVCARKQPRDQTRTSEKSKMKRNRRFVITINVARTQMYSMPHMHRNTS